MHGFAATPVIFIAIILITTTFFLHFSEMDRTVANGILKEAEGSLAAADAMKIESENRTAIYLKAKEVLSGGGGANEVKGNLTDAFKIDFSVVDETTRLIVTYTLNTTLENLNKTQTYTEVINVS